MISPVGGTPYIPPSQGDPTPTPQDIKNDLSYVQSTVNEIKHLVDNHGNITEIQEAQGELQTFYSQLDSDLKALPAQDFVGGKSSKDTALLQLEKVRKDCTGLVQMPPDISHVNDIIANLNSINTCVFGPSSS